MVVGACGCWRFKNGRWLPRSLVRTHPNHTLLPWDVSERVLCASEDSVDACEDADDPKQALIELLLEAKLQEEGARAGDGGKGEGGDAENELLALD